MSRAPPERQRSLRKILSAEEEGVERRMRSLRRTLPKNLQRRGESTFREYRQFQGLHHHRGIDHDSGPKLSRIPTRVFEFQFRQTLRKNASGQVGGVQHVEGDHRVFKYPRGPQGFREFIVLPESGGDRRKNLDGILCIIVRGENVIGLVRTQLSQENLLRIDSDIGKQESVLRAKYQLD